MGLKSEDAYTTQLQAILRIAHDLKEVAAVSGRPASTPTPTPTPTVVGSIRLPSPRPLFPLLVDAGFSHEVATAANKIYLQRAEELRHHIEESILATWHKIVELPVSAPALPPDLLVTKVISTSKEVYLRRLEQWKEDIIQRIEHAWDMQRKVTPKNAFNYEYVPLLEHFFGENPFPTHADKMFLAKKSNMQYRQIHVWFQNRRSRTKREGRVLRKKPTYLEGVTKPLGKSCEVKGHMVKCHSRAPKTCQVGLSEGATKIEILQNNLSKNNLISSSPLHAFPSPYPPTCWYDPFPCKSGPAGLGTPGWRRTSCGKPPRPPSTSIEELVGKFSQLNVRDETRSNGSPDLPTHAATVAITVVPSRAPHPSLIVPTCRQPTNIVQRYPIVRAPIRNSGVFQSTGPTSKSLTLVSPSILLDTSEFAGKRKTAPLPRRSPFRMRSASRDTTPSESSLTSSCSFSPDSEGHSYFSSISSLSTPSDLVNDQEPPPSESPCRSPLDSLIHLHDLGEVAVTVPSFAS